MSRRRGTVHGLPPPEDWRRLHHMQGQVPQLLQERVLPGGEGEAGEEGAERGGAEVQEKPREVFRGLFIR